MPNYSKIIVVGHLGRDAVVNKVGDKSVINFNVAVTEKFQSQGQAQEKTVWFDCAKWGENTNVAQYLKKGTAVLVEGQPDLRTYTSKEGTPGASISIRVGSLSLMGSKPAENGQNNAQQQPQSQQYSQQQPQQQNSSANNSAMSEPLDDLPF